MMELHSQRAFQAAQKIVHPQRKARQTVPTFQISEDLLQIILISFVSLDLTPHEMSRASGISLEVILEGLAKRH